MRVLVATVGNRARARLKQYFLTRYERRTLNSKEKEKKKN